MENKIFGYKSYINGKYRMMITDLFGILVLGYKNQKVRDDMADLYKTKGFYVDCWVVE